MAENNNHQVSISADAPVTAADAPVAIKETVINPHDLITKNDVEICLEKDMGQSACLQSFKIIDFTKKGDNYASFVTSVKVNYQNEESEDHECSYVVKVNCGRSNYAKAFTALFTKEVGFYTEVLPVLNKELEKMNEPQLRVPRYFHSVKRDQQQLIYMEDLRQCGFEMFDHKKGMDKKRTDLVLKELARFHGASNLMLSKKEFEGSNLKLKFPFLAEPFELIKENDPSDTKNFFKNILVNGIKVAKSCGYDKVVKFLNPKLPTVFDDYKNVLKATERFRVICHGDCWNNNFLFKCDPETDEVVDCRLLDMQMIRVGSPVLDMTYMFCCSLHGDVRKSNLDHFLDVYYTKCTSMLTVVSVGMQFTLSQLKEEYHKKGFYGLISALQALPTLLRDSEDVPDSNSAFFEQSIEKLSQKNQKLKNRILEIFDEMIEDGVIN